MEKDSFGKREVLVGRVTEDRRVRRTRELLEEALVALILEKGYETVTVQDVLDKADVGRSTFYAHYRNKDELLLGAFDEMRASLEAHARGNGEDFSLGLFRHAQSYRRLYRSMVGKRSGNLFLDRLREHLSEHARERIGPGSPDAAVPLDVAVEYLVSSLLGLLIWWLDHDLPYSPEKMNEMFEELTTPGLRAALGKEGAESE